MRGYHENPMEWIVSALYATQTVCVGFHSSPDEGVCNIMNGNFENKPRRYEKECELRRAKTKKETDQEKKTL